MESVITEILNKLTMLKEASGDLEPQRDIREKQMNVIDDYCQDFIDQLPNKPAYSDSKDKGSALYDYEIKEDGRQLEDIIEIFDKQVDRHGLNPASAGHLGYIPGGGLFPAAMGDYLADITNKYSGVFYASSGAARMENMMVKWMCELVGFKEDAGGYLSSGGSMANLTAIVAARYNIGVKARDFEKLVIYMTRQVHHSVNKAIRILALEEAVIRYIPMDAGYRMKAESLRNQIQADLVSGLRPFIIIASVGTTDTGAVDPISDIGDIAREHKIWLHVDGAYGGFFILSNEGQEIIKGLEKADSITMDPHKTLFLPYGIGAVLVKDKSILYKSLGYKAAYMQDTFEASEEDSPADFSPELTKHFRGLRMWLPLQLYGLKPFRSALSEKIWLTRYFYEQLKNKPDYEVGPYPELSVMLFRYIPESGDPNEFNTKLQEAIVKDGRVFLSSTTMDGIYWIRLAAVCFRTHVETIDLTLEIIEDCVHQLKLSENQMDVTVSNQEKI